MAYRINEGSCSSCGACYDACPIGAIKNMDEFYVIDEGMCIGCGDCVNSCSNNAIEKGE